MSRSRYRIFEKAYPYIHYNPVRRGYVDEGVH